jgi:hypothetical protein
LSWAQEQGTTARRSGYGAAGLRVEPGGQIFEDGLGFAGRAELEALGEAGVVAGEAFVGFAQLASPGGEAGEVGADDELQLQKVEGAGALDRFDEQALRFGGRSIPELEQNPRSGETRVRVIGVLPASLDQAVARSSSSSARSRRRAMRYTSAAAT